MEDEFVKKVFVSGRSLTIINYTRYYHTRRYLLNFEVRLDKIVYIAKTVLQKFQVCGSLSAKNQKNCDLNNENNSNSFVQLFPAITTTSTTIAQGEYITKEFRKYLNFKLEHTSLLLSQCIPIPKQ